MAVPGTARESAPRCYRQTPLQEREREREPERDPPTPPLVGSVAPTCWSGVGAEHSLASRKHAAQAGAPPPGRRRGR